MRIRILFVFTGLFLLLFSCNNDNKRTGNEKKQNAAVIQEPTPRTIVIQPFDDFSQIILDSLQRRLNKVFTKVTINPSTPLPQNAYYEPRNRYRADSLLLDLWYRAPKNNIVLGLTNKDISITKGGYKDWGIIGIAGGIPSRVCVVSTFRLSKPKLDEHLYKVVIHELGHTDGLHHCDREDWCLMRSYEGGYPIDKLTDFCLFCKLHLKQKGWKLD